MVINALKNPNMTEIPSDLSPLLCGTELMLKRGKVEIWEITDLPRYNHFERHLKTIADGVIFVFDITRKQTFDKLKLLYNEIESLERKRFVAYSLIANSCFNKDREVTSTEISDFSIPSGVVDFEELTYGIHDENIKNIHYAANTLYESHSILKKDLF